MTSERDLARAIKTAFVHCRAGGVALFQPDFVRETFKSGRTSGGHAEGGCSLRYVETTRARGPTTPVVDVEFAITMKGSDGVERATIDHHVCGAFSRATWLKLLRATGFRVRRIVDPWKRECFLARRPMMKRA